jgi:hypothetical protein
MLLRRARQPVGREIKGPVEPEDVAEALSACRSLDSLGPSQAETFTGARWRRFQLALLF